MEAFKQLEPQDSVWKEVGSCVAAWPIWAFLGLNDIRTKYRRTFLGPWWVVLGMGIALGLMSILWSTIFGLDWRTYLPYMISGIITWYWLSTYINQSCDLFTNEFAPLMRSLPMPSLIYVLRFVARGFFLFLHYLPIYMVAALVTLTPPSPYVLVTLPIGFAFIIVNAIAVSQILGMISARFRDIPPAVTAFMTPMLLLTPIIWEPSMLGNYRFIADLNPFTHLVAIVRGPLIGVEPTLFNWAFVVGITGVNVLTSLVFYRKYRHYLIFWI